MRRGGARLAAHGRPAGPHVPRPRRDPGGPVPGRRPRPRQGRARLRPAPRLRVRELCRADHRRRGQAPLQGPPVGPARAAPHAGAAQPGQGRAPPSGEPRGRPPARRGGPGRGRRADPGRGQGRPGRPGELPAAVPGRGPRPQRRRRLPPRGHHRRPRRRVRARGAHGGRPPQAPRTAGTRTGDPVPALLPGADAARDRRAARHLADARLPPAEPDLRTHPRRGRGERGQPGAPDAAAPHIRATIVR